MYSRYSLSKIKDLNLRSAVILVFSTIFFAGYLNTARAVDYEFREVLRSDLAWDAVYNSQSDRIIIGDVDLDGKNELLLWLTFAELENISVAVFDSHQNNGFDLTWMSPGNLNPRNCTFGDIYGTGRGTIIIDHEETFSYHSVVAIESNFPGIFQGDEPAFIWSGQRIEDIWFGDSDGDDNNEVLVVFAGGNGLSSLEYNSSAGNFDPTDLMDGYPMTNGGPVFTEDYDDESDHIETIFGDKWNNPHLYVLEDRNLQSTTENVYLLDYHTIDLDQDSSRELSVKRWDDNHEHFYHAVMEDAGAGSWEEVWSREMMHNNMGYAQEYIASVSGAMYPSEIGGCPDLDGIVLQEFNSSGDYIVIRTFSYFDSGSISDSLHETWNSENAFDQSNIASVIVQALADGDNDNAPEIWLTVNEDDGSTYLSCFELSWFDYNLPDNLDFGEVIIQSGTASTQNTSILNTGNNTPLEIIGYETTNESFLLDVPGDSTITIEQNDSLIIFISFQPDQLGLIEGEALFHLADTTLSISLTGTGTTLPAGLIFDPEDQVENYDEFDEWIELEGEIPDDSTITSTQVFFRPACSVMSDSEYKDGDINTIQRTVKWSIRDMSGNSTGIEYYLEYGNGIDTLTLPPNAPDSVYFMVRSLPNHAIDIQLPEMLWIMLGAPYNLNYTGVEDVLIDDLGPFNPDIWKAYQWDSGSFVEINTPADSVFVSGRSIWVKGRNAAEIDFGDGETHRTDIPFRIDLQGGWNMIANPLYKTVYHAGIEVSDDALVDTVLWSWSGMEYNELSQSSDTLPAGNGAFIYVDADTDNAWITLDAEVIPPALQNSFAASFSIFEMEINMNSAGQSDKVEIALSLDGAEQLWGAPPSPPGGSRLYLLIPDQDRACRRTVLPWDGEGRQYSLVVEGTDDITRTLEFTRSSGNTDECTFAVLNPRTEVMVFEDAQENGVVLESTGKQAIFTLVVGTSDFINSQTGDYNLLPAANNLEDPYPNPFNDQTIISYHLAKNTPVRLTVYDILGREVNLLVSSEIQEAGYYKIVWDGHNCQGNEAASGLYFVHAQLGNTVFTRRILLLR
ncbi:MAG: T9SS type A sorting domain-containing protein [FCB group bacterium]|nr:T9SS type A sorting domain-containing protein [FCB group bacterium]